ncbi:hypothetical protein A8990_102133 [Paenibacillus taihuensis]|uniref:Uncharacterized protein n=1 Tax=Paenibacillus taihuensis TaxID=1156355 RepID=A0A3D9SEM8_9BACL|nr:hypothetical protein [Paenibacillus taihuensis]REE93047.1 hypothetical protein A8990_102133 [Paenibacillus taihuensis]
MKDFIQLLFSNIYVVIIVIGFLFTMINKARGKQNPTNRMPSFGGEPTKRQPAHQPAETRMEQPVRRPEQRMTTPAPAPAPVPAPMYTTQMKPRGEMIPSQSLVDETDELQRTFEAERSSAPRSSRSAIGAGAARQTEAQSPQRAQQASAAFRTPQGEELRRAFVMAEVLGPPRSKRSLRRM